MVARKSRKNLMEEHSGSRNSVCMVAGYVRLSVVKEGQPCDSIATQTAIIEDAVAQSRGDMLLHKIYIDEKVSGTTFERKAFQEMLSDIEKGLITCIMVKDLSRLGRDFLETGYYIEQHFPCRGVRFISIADEFDTTDGMTNNKRRESMNGIRIPMTNLFNAKYVEDISNKTQATIDYMIRHGKYVAPRAPYGYMKDPADCHALIVDPEAAVTVKAIFEMADKGAGLNEIVRHLHGAKILPPLEYAKSHGLEGNFKQGTGLWNTRSVKKILTNRVYVGDLMQGKENYIVKDTHEALVDRETFTRIQWTFSKSAEVNKAKAKPASDNLLKGKVICGCCGGKMQRRRGSGNADWHFFTCITNNRLGAGNCSGMYIREAVIMDAIRAEISKCVDTHKDVAMNYKRDKAVLNEKLFAAQSNLDIHIDQLQYRFEQNFHGRATQEEFEQAVAEKQVADQAVQAVEHDMAQLDEAYQNNRLYCQAIHEELAFESIVRSHLEKVAINKGGVFSVLLL